MLANFVQQQTTTAGTGTIELVDVTGRKTFVEAFGSGARVRYAIVNADGTQREIGYGTVTDAAPDTLTREQVVESTNNDALVNFNAGAKNVYVAGGDVELLKFGGAVPLQVAGGTLNARTLTHVPPVKAVVAGMEFEFINGNEANDAAATLTVDTDFEFTILRPDGSALQPGDMPASRILRVRIAGDDDDEAWLTDLPETAASVVLGGTISPASLSASQNDWNPTGWAGASIIRVTSSGEVDLTGLTGGRAGRVAIVQNIGTNVETLKNESASSSAANRFALGGGDLALSGGASALLIYDGTSSRWRLIASAKGSGGSIGGSETITAGEDLADRDQIYQDIFNQRGNGATRWYKIDADAVGPVRISPRRGIALQAITAAATGEAQVRAGRVSGFTSLTAGAPVWASATAGAVTQTAPAIPSSGAQLASCCLGVAASATEIDFDPAAGVVFVARNSALAVDGTITVEHWPDDGARDRELGAYLVQVPSSAPISGGTGTNIGDFTFGSTAGLPGIFDGVTNQANVNGGGKASATSGYFGKTYSGGKRITQAVVWGSNTDGYVNGADPTITLVLRGKTGTAPASRTDGTSLGSVSFTDTSNESGNPRTITSNDTTTVWDHVWIDFSHNGGAANCFVAETQFTEISGNARDEELDRGSWTVDATSTTKIVTRFDDGAGANAATKSTFKNRSGATRDLAVEVAL